MAKLSKKWCAYWVFIALAVYFLSFNVLVSLSPYIIMEKGGAEKIRVFRFVDVGHSAEDALYYFYYPLLIADQSYTNRIYYDMCEELHGVSHHGLGEWTIIERRTEFAGPVEKSLSISDADNSAPK